MFIRRKKPLITREEALRARPRRLVDAQMQLMEDGSGGGRLPVLVAPPRWGRWLFRMSAGATKTFEFDAIGVFVWNHCDGKTSVQQIIRMLASDYQLNLRQAEVPTVRFLQTLSSKGLIGLKMKSGDKVR